MTAGQQAECARILFSAIPALAGPEFRALASLMDRGALGRESRMTNAEIAGHLRCHPGSVRRLLDTLESSVNPFTGLPWIRVTLGTRSRTILVNRMPAPERARPADRPPEPEALGISPRAFLGGGGG